MAETIAPGVRSAGRNGWIEYPVNGLKPDDVLYTCLPLFHANALNLTTGFAEAVLAGELVIGDTGDTQLVTQLLEEYQIDTVFHFAAHTIVPESVSDPMKYYANNTCSSRNLLQCCQQADVKNFVFSSTAAVYGIPALGKADEDTPATGFRHFYPGSA